MASPSRQFPVTIDPTYASGTVLSTYDAYVQSNVTTDQSGMSELKIGTRDSGAVVSRSFLNFPQASLKGKTIVSALLSLHQTFAPTCTAQPMNVNRVSALPTTSTTWANAPGVGAATWSASFNKGDAACAAARVSVPITDLVRNWSTDNGEATWGVRLAAASETNNNQYKRFASSETADDPYITYTYSRAPGTAAVPQTLQSSTWNGQIYVSSTTPSFSSTATDPDGNQIKYAAQVHSNTTGASIVSSCWTGLGTSGGRASCTSAPALTNGSTYYVRAMAQDETEVRGPFS